MNMKMSTDQNSNDDILVVSEVVLSTMRSLKRTATSIFKQVPDLYYDTFDSENNSYDEHLSSPSPSSSSRMRMLYNKKRQNSENESSSSYSTSCLSSTTTESSSSGMDEESNSSTITTRPSMMMLYPSSSFAADSRVGAAVAATADCQPAESTRRTLLLVKQNARGRPKELVFQSAGYFNTTTEPLTNQQQILDNEDQEIDEQALKEKQDDDLWFQDLENIDKEDDEESIKTRRLSLMWDKAQALARQGTNLDLNHFFTTSEGTTPPPDTLCDTVFELPPGIGKDDIMVTIDIDDEARLSRVMLSQSPRNDDAALLLLTRHRCDTDTISNTSSAKKQDRDKSLDENNHNSNALALSKSTSTLSVAQQQRYLFEEAVRHLILSDLQSIYTANAETAQLVLCIVICVLSDGSIRRCNVEEEAESAALTEEGGRVGLAELALNWRLFGADDLKVYQGGMIVQRKDYGGFGPSSSLSSSIKDDEDDNEEPWYNSAEGEYHIISQLAPRAANAIVQRIGGVNQDFLAEI